MFGFRKERTIIQKLISIVALPLTYVSACWLKRLRETGISNLENKVFMRAGMIPVIDHYYEPMINPKKYLKESLRTARKLPAINFNDVGQLEILSKFHYQNELISLPVEKTKEGFYYNNKFYESGDADYYYSLIRFRKPKIIIEIGSGFSTLVAELAIQKNKDDDDQYSCRLVCIEPYQNEWLKKTSAEVIRTPVEFVEPELFALLSADDILFIDSSHIIRPQGDVLYEYLELLPSLKKGVLVHIHDIFTPHDYPDAWHYDEHLFWNEQYLLEAFLSFNKDFKIIGALNYLAHFHKAALDEKLPIFAQQSGREPGAFWIERC